MAATATTAEMRAPPRRERSFFGHPVGLAYLAFTEVWERFSFYGMQALLLLYMVEHLYKPGRIETIAGFQAYRGTVEALLGPMSTTAIASQTFGLYAGMAYLTPLIGGWLGDRVLGQRRAVIIGAVLMAFGHLVMASERWFLAALTLLILGSGFLKGNLTVQIGRLYDGNDPRRTQAYGVYVIAVNIGAVLAPLICGTLGEVYGWHVGFGAAAVGMVIALVIYLSGRRHLPPDLLDQAAASDLKTRSPLSAADWRAIVAVLVSFIPYIVGFAALNQAYAVFALWASSDVDRVVFGRTVPVTWFFTLDGILSIVAVAISMRIWRWQARRGREPDELSKLAIGCALCSAGFLVLAAASAAGSPTHIAAPVLFFVLVDLSIPFIFVACAAFTARHAPQQVSALMMSLFLAGFAISNFTAGWLGGFYDQMSPRDFWFLHAGVAATGVVFAVAGKAFVGRLLSSDRSQ
jgi:POT family proton-dependent oligopeptide transporter